MTMRDDVLTLACLIADDPSAAENTHVERLVARGFDLLHAELLVAFVPLGLARAIIARLPIDPPVRLSETALIQDAERNRMLEVRLGDIPEFEIACQMGEETFLTNDIPREQLRAASRNSMELNLVSQALTAGKADGAKISAPILLRLTDVPGFEGWYRSVCF